MAEADGLKALVADLARIPASHRRQVLGALTPVERAAIERLLGQDAVDEAPPAAMSFETCFSPWLVPRLKEAEAGKGAMTPATRHVLLRAAREAMNKSPIATRAAAGQPSLFQIVFGALRWRRAAV
ncbi:hypothetical protein [Sphingosinicella sp.]|uniref:hypothetical protein n=1 Tax=Sphingosinicella sp. TaxID=1917971 RepID=UPI004037E889